MLECDRCNAKDLPEKTHTDHTYLYCRSQAKKNSKLVFIALLNYNYSSQRPWSCGAGWAIVLTKELRFL